MVTKNKNRIKQGKKPKKVNNLRHAEYYDMQGTFDGLFAKAGTKGEIYRRSGTARCGIIYAPVQRNDAHSPQKRGSCPLGFLCSSLPALRLAFSISRSHAASRSPQTPQLLFL
jgi:hypothetical protein